MLVKYNRPNVHTAYGLLFTPGVNNIDPVKWAVAKKDSEIQYFLEEKIMEEVAVDAVMSDATKKLVANVEKANGVEAAAKASGDKDALSDLKDKTSAAQSLLKASDQEVPPITSLPQKDAIKLVSETYAVALLKGWLDTEKRATVRRAIEVQAEKIKGGEAQAS